MNGLDPSTKPYFIRALYEWCGDRDLTPHLAVFVDSSVRVPMQYVKDNEIVLNISGTAVSGLKIGNDWIEFSARFGGVPHEIVVPASHVMAIYARENGQGMAFPLLLDAADAGGEDDEAEDVVPDIQLVSSITDANLDSPDPETPPDDPAPGPRGRPRLKRIK